MKIFLILCVNTWLFLDYIWMVNDEKTTISLAFRSTFPQSSFKMKSQQETRNCPKNCKVESINGCENICQQENKQFLMNFLSDMWILSTNRNLCKLYETIIKWKTFHCSIEIYGSDAFWKVTNDNGFILVHIYEHIYFATTLNNSLIIILSDFWSYFHDQASPVTSIKITLD